MTSHNPTRFLVRPQRPRPTSTDNPATPDLPMVLVCECGDVLDLGVRPILADIQTTAELHRRLKHPTTDDVLRSIALAESSGNPGNRGDSIGPWQIDPERADLPARPRVTSWPEADQPEPGAISQLDRWDGVGLTSVHGGNPCQACGALAGQPHRQVGP